MQAAEKLLRTTTLPITEIAIQCGFSNSAYFAKMFRELRNVTPSQYRTGRVGWTSRSGHYR